MVEFIHAANEWQYQALWHVLEELSAKRRRKSNRTGFHSIMDGAAWPTLEHFPDGNFESLFRFHRSQIEILLVCFGWEHRPWLKIPSRDPKPGKKMHYYHCPAETVLLFVLRRLAFAARLDDLQDSFNFSSSKGV